MKGCYQDKRTGRWQTHVKLGGKGYGLGTYNDMSTATKAVQFAKDQLGKGHDIIHVRWAVKQALMTKDTC